jgi:lipopolysaccharide export system protein LptA
VGVRGIAILLLAVCLGITAPVFAQGQPPSEKLILTAKTASTWSKGPTDVVQLDGPLTIELDQARMSADRAVVWMMPASEQDLNVQNVQVALIGNAKVEQASITRSGPRLYAMFQVRGGKISIVADNRIAEDRSGGELYREASNLRALQEPVAPIAATEPATALTRSASRPTSPRVASTQPTTRPASYGPIEFSYRDMQTLQTDDGTVGVVLTGGVKLLQARPSGDFIELQADRVVLFTTLHSLKEIAEPRQRNRNIRDSIVGAYLEGDVRINYSPNRPRLGEQRLTADRVYYDFTNDRAILTNAIVHTNDPMRGMPMVARAKVIRQLSVGEYKADHAQLSSSSFAIPSLSLGLDKLYIRQEPSDNPQVGSRAVFQGQGVTFQAYDVPFFWLPYASGSLERGEPLRSLSFGNSNIYGVEAMTEWGLFETLGMLPPRDIDVNYRLDYMSDHGPAFGLNASYGGGFLTDTTKQPWDFSGDFRSYFVDDHGFDDLGRLPVRQNAPDELRGQVLWEHQHFFPDNWQAQVRAGYVSDPTFMEEYFRGDFETGPPRDLMGYLKHQDGPEAFTLRVEAQPNQFVTTANMQQEQFEVERLPELQYWRIGDSLAHDQLTFFSENRGGGLRFQQSRATLQEQGFAPPSLTPGLPALGTTGVTGDVVWRGDSRQELDWPMSVGPMRVVPYVMGRYTAYSEEPVAPERERGFIGAGAHISTQIWKTDPVIENDLLDIHQLRHVIEPQVNLFTSASNVDSQHVYIYDEDVDKINDVSVLSAGVNQRWQTKRGGPGAWRSTDVFSFNFDVDWFANKPPKSVRNPYNFRGLFFESLPEASIPRDAANADASWRISDNTVVLADASWNLDKSEIQTMAIGVLVRRDVRMSYFIGNRYIGDANSNITSVHVDYQISSKYMLGLDQEFDFTQGHNVYSSIGLLRRFDTFYLVAGYSYDEVTKQNGFTFNIIPIGFGQGLNTGQFQTFRR